jgi:hypothetical protein
LRESAARFGTLLVLCLTAGAAQAADGDPAGVRGFARRMIAGIGAEERECRPEIAREIQAREMNVVCASFDGSFARFELRWDLALYDGAGSSRRGTEPPEPAAHPLTEWESNGTQHDRIYRVQQKAVGVRFTGGGELLVVW